MTYFSIRPGPRNLITDVPGLAVGHAQDERAETGTTVLLCDGFWTGGVDVRGGAPGVREAETLAPENLVGRAHAVVFSGGSVFGLAAHDAVTAQLSARGVGLNLRPATPPTPIVAGAVLYDLAHGGDKAWGVDPPYGRLGREALDAVAADFSLGAVGAGRGAKAGVAKGGIGSASAVIEGGLVVGALAAVNPVGDAYMPDGETLWAWPFEIDAEFGGRKPGEMAPASDPLPLGARIDAERLKAGLNTTLAVVAVNADLTTAECKRVAMMAQDGLARAIRPAHTPFDGDVVFALASGERRLGEDRDLRALAVAALGSAAADVLARAIARGVYEAR